MPHNVKCSFILSWRQLWAVRWILAHFCVPFFIVLWGSVRQRRKEEEEGLYCLADEGSDFNPSSNEREEWEVVKSEHNLQESLVVEKVEGAKRIYRAKETPKNATKNEDHSLESLINKNKGQLHLAVLPSSILLRSKHLFFFFLYRIDQQRSSKQAWKAAMAGLYKHFMHFFLPALSIGCVCVCVSFKEEQLQEGILFKMSRIYNGSTNRIFAN